MNGPDASLTGYRLERYRFELMDSDEQVVTEIDTVTRGELSHNVASELRSSGSIELAEIDGVDWLDARVRITYLVGDVEYPLGIYMVASPKRETDGMVTKRSLELYSKLLVLTDDKLDESWVLPAGSNVTEAIASIIMGTGETSIALTPSVETTAVDRVWLAGTSKLRVVNDLLDSINYFSLTVDTGGFFVARPYVPPEARGSVWTFADDELGLYLPDVSADEDYWHIPNKVVLVGGTTDEEMVAVATDLDSPYGYNTRGRWIVEHRTGEDATSLDVLQAKAERVLVEGRQVTQSISYAHAFVPLTPNDVVTFANRPLGLSARYSLQAQRHTLNERLGASVTSTIKRVVS